MASKMVDLGELAAVKREVALERALHEVAQAGFRRIGLDRLFGSDFDDRTYFSIAQMKLELTETIVKIDGLKGHER